MRRLRPRLYTPIGEFAAYLNTNHHGEEDERDEDQTGNEEDDEDEVENSECEKDGRSMEEASLSPPQNVDLSSVEFIRELLRTSCLKRPALPSLLCYQADRLRLDGQLKLSESSGNAMADAFRRPKSPPTRAAQKARTIRWRRDVHDAVMDARRRQPRSHHLAVPEDQPSLFGIEERRLRRKRARRERRVLKQMQKFHKHMQRYRKPTARHERENNATFKSQHT